ncbi:MAG: polyhydroxyalkanoate depolymerase [Limnobacter sp.]|nr:polyhydroxyalkanoate depolymerase [Limnobacter sp.]
MLYQIHEFQRALLNPLTVWADAASKAFSNPFSPLAHFPLSKRVSANLELIYRLGKEYEKPEFGIDTVKSQGREVSVVQEIVESRPFCKLLHFRKMIPAETRPLKPQPKVLVFAPLSGHHSTLLRDTVRTLLQDHEVYVTDWVDARMVALSEGPFHLDDYVHYCIDFIRLLGPDLHLLSVCQPTVPVLAAVSLMATEQDPALPKSMTMMGGPIDPRESPTEVNALAAKKPLNWFKHNVIYSVPHTYPGYLRKVYPGFLQHIGFVSMNPDRHVQSHYDFYLHLLEGDGDSAENHRRFYDEYNAVLDMPAEYYLDTIKTVFQEHLLPKGKWKVRGKLVKPADIKTVALLTIEGELDDISGPGQTRAAHTLCSGIPKSNKQDFLAPECGHYGIFSGRRWREMIYPKLTEFIRDHA